MDDRQVEYVMGFINNLRIGTRFALAFILPLLGLAWFSGQAVYQQVVIAGEMAALRPLAHFGTTMSALVHELQKERGASATFLNAKGQTFGDKVDTQRKLTDGTLATLRGEWQTFDFQVYGPGMVDIAAAADRNLQRLAEMRRRVTALDITPAEEIKYYTDTISTLVAVIARLGVLSTDTGLANSIFAYVALIETKERAGLERATGSAGFAAGKLTPALYERFVRMLAEQDAFARQFGIFASPEQATMVADTVQGRAVEDVARLRKVVLKSAETGTMDNVPPSEWWDNITAKIDLMKTAEDQLAAGIEAKAHDLATAATARLTAFVLAIAVLLAATMALVWVIVRGVTDPVAAMTGVMTRLARGEMAVDIVGRGRRDEIGEMAEAVHVFKDRMVEAERLRSEQAAMKAGAEAKRHREMADLADDLETKVKGVVQTVSGGVGHIVDTAGGMGRKLETGTSRSLDVAEASDRTSHNVDTVAAAAEQLSASIREISRQVARSADVASAAVADAERANAQVRGLSDAANKIGEVVALINQIAGQTNLLALNATIEAARAGDAGKGFAVVANEVKTLAHQTGKATGEIAAQVAAVQAATRGAVEAIQGIGGTIVTLNEISTAVAAAVEEQGAATDEIARNVRSVSSDAQKVSETMTSVTQNAASSYGSAIRIIWSAADLNEPVARLQNEVDAFLTKVRSG